MNLGYYPDAQNHSCWILIITPPVTISCLSIRPQLIRLNTKCILNGLVPFSLTFSSEIVLSPPKQREAKQKRHAGDSGCILGGKVWELNSFQILPILMKFRQS